MSEAGAELPPRKVAEGCGYAWATGPPSGVLSADGVGRDRGGC